MKSKKKFFKICEKKSIDVSTIVTDGHVSIQIPPELEAWNDNFFQYIQM